MLGQPLRRVQSEREIGHHGSYPTHPSEQHREAASGEVFDFESHSDEPSAPRAPSQVQDGRSSFVARSYRRHRSRSLPRNYIPSEPHLPVDHPEPDPSVTRQNHFILMEDLTGRLKYSCVLDLKMGTRQYGMDATLAKKKSQRKKCDRTTSRTLGVRRPFVRR